MGFEISKAAGAKHHITNERAASEGIPLRDALEALLADVCVVAERGGAIALELHRAGLADKVEAWSQIVTKGFCTMCPVVMKWVCSSFFDVSGLKDMVQAVLPAASGLLSRHHDAGEDACMAWLVLRELYARAGRSTV